ncbi:uncharacterized protein LOC120155558 [Hibiscus syriacus]|uniref:uncharacterized protein LOC120155558 n=1 Tax=Hibiscus syriacus TaxID=106335 RepID=UPI001924DDB9|nr:uncharacterized protein LOC120155558 [Hibiscus syriacus]
MFLAILRSARTGDIWSEITRRDCRIVWHKLIWFPLHVPKYAMVAWFAILNRFATKDRLRRMGTDMDSVCALCADADKSKNHIFFECAFSVRVWSVVLGLCGLDRSTLSWDQELDWAVSCLKDKCLTVKLLKLAWNAFIYCIWEECYMGLFGGSIRSQCDIFYSLKEIFGFILYGRKFDRTDPTNAKLCIEWDLLD